jgi:ElaB/YqjD/DUF883 family membrane-anchored ribosome-binding protein
MSLKATAQIQPLFELVDNEPKSSSSSSVVEEPVNIDSENILEVGETPPEISGFEDIHVLEPQDDVIEVNLELGEVPGADKPIPVEELVVHEANPPEVSEEEEKKEKDENDAKSKKNSKWDWASKGAHGFVIWVKERFDDVPKHSGQDTAGLERALSYLEKLDNEISRAMRLDLDGELDANKVEEIRSKIDDGISRLQDRLDKIRKVKKNKRKKTSEITNDNIIKEAQKVIGVKGVYITVPLLISGIARVCINGAVSAGHDIEDMFEKLSKKFKLNDREKYETMILLFDMGYPMRKDRGFMADEDVDETSSDNFDWMAGFRS